MAIILITIIFIIFILAIALVVLYDCFISFKKHKAASKGIINYDSSMYNFCYKTTKTSTEIVDCLKTNSIYDSLKYDFNDKELTITFGSELPEGYYSICYLICIIPKENYTLLKITQLDNFFNRNIFMHSLNEFWGKKLEAEPIPYFN